MIRDAIRIYTDLRIINISDVVLESKGHSEAQRAPLLKSGHYWTHHLR